MRTMTSIFGYTVVYMYERMAICLKGQTGVDTRLLHQGPCKSTYAPLFF